ncbi:MAG: DUF29 domain-containing protein [Geminicoccaceae bacterium]|nr:DUF29 domain-containing protein [Geminicoccaceae bacterium]
MNVLRPEDLYDEDFFAWTQLQARELRRFARTRPNLPLDLAHIAEEIQDLGKEQRNALRSWTRRVIEHLLLLEHSPAAGPRAHWIGEIVNFRQDVADRLSPVLERDLRRRLPRLYNEAVRGLAKKLAARGESDIVNRFPGACPYALDQILGDWWPENPMRPRRGGPDDERSIR